MPAAPGPSNFPDVTSKLAAPPKKTQWEKQKAEEAAKAARQQEETDAALREFMQEHGGNEGSASGRSRSGVLNRLADDEPDRKGGYMGGKRHHPARQNPGQSGPGSLGGLGGSGPGSLGPLNTFRKRASEAPREYSSRFDRPGPGGRDVKAAFLADEDEVDQVEGANKTVEREAPKPTLRLASLPPQIAEATVKAMLPKYLQIESIKAERSAERRTAQRPSKSLIVTLAQNTTSKDIDRAANELQRKYLGWGFHLSISRHLSSTALAAGPVHGSISNTRPFGATDKPLKEASESKFAPPPEQQTGYSRFERRSEVNLIEQVTVTPPSSLNEIRLINKTVEKLLLHGPEFEALLKRQPHVQQDPNWSWIWDSQSAGGVWYRWQLWKTWHAFNTQSQRFDRNRPGGLPKKFKVIFQGEAPWCEPEQSLQFMSSTKFEELVEHADYEALDENSDNEKRADSKPVKEASETSFLNPLERSKLVYQLARLPVTIAKLRKGDVARLTGFAIQHTNAAEEVVELLISNVQNPIANVFERQNRDSGREGAEPQMADDNTGGKLIGLYVLSDILFAASVSGVFLSWRYRDIIETALQKRKIFESLGKLGRIYGWGKMRADKWKRSVFIVLDLWEARSVFNQDTQALFRKAFTTSSDTVREEDERAESKPVEFVPNVDGPAEIPDEQPLLGLRRERTPKFANDDDEDLEVMDVDEDALQADILAAEEDEMARTEVGNEQQNPEKVAPSTFAQGEKPSMSISLKGTKSPEPSKEPGRRRRPQASDLF